MSLTTKGIYFPDVGDPPNGPTQMQSLAQSVNDKAMPSVVTALPGAPFDGQEIILRTATNNGTFWRFRYDAAITDTWKWRSVGGVELWIQDGSPYAPGADTAVHNDPVLKLTVPVAGVYRFQGGGPFTVTGSNSWSISRHDGSPSLGTWWSAPVTGEFNNYPTQEQFLNTGETVGFVVAKLSSGNTLSRNAGSRMSLWPVRVG